MKAALVLDAGACWLSSIAPYRAIKGASVPAGEPRICNVNAREAFRHRPSIAPVAMGIGARFGVDGCAPAIGVLGRLAAKAAIASMRQP